MKLQYELNPLKTIPYNEVHKKNSIMYPVVSHLNIPFRNVAMLTKYLKKS